MQAINDFTCSTTNHYVLWMNIYKAGMLYLAGTAWDVLVFTFLSGRRVVPQLDRLIPPLSSEAEVTCVWQQGFFLSLTSTSSEKKNEKKKI